MEIIFYGTEEFKKFESNNVISIEKAWLLQIQYYKDKNQNLKFPLYFVVDGNYVFSPYSNPKIPEASLTGVWVNATTGEVKYVENSQKIKPKSQFGWKGK